MTEEQDKRNEQRNAVIRACEHYLVRFYGGLLAGMLRAYPGDQGERIVLPCSNGDVVEYERDTGVYAQEELETTGHHVFKCVRNGLAQGAKQ